MAEMKPARAHVITGGFPPGSPAGHDHDYARLRLLEKLEEREVPASVANDYDDVEKWLAVSRFLITYVAGPFPNAEQSRAIWQWMEEGGRWFGLHGTSGGRAVRVDGQRQRRTVKMDHHAVLGGYFLTHPPICRIRLDVGDGPGTLTEGLPSAFEVEDEPYIVEIQDPVSTNAWLTAVYGPDVTSPLIGTVYEQDTSLLPDGKTRVLGFTRAVGQGGVTYVALGHCHNPAIRAQRPGGIDPNDPTPALFRGSWENATFQRLLRNAVAWGMGG